MWDDVTWLYTILSCLRQVYNAAQRNNLWAANSFKCYGKFWEDSWQLVVSCQTPWCHNLSLLCHEIKWLAKFSSQSGKDLMPSKSVSCRRIFLILINVVIFIYNNLCTQENKVSLFRTSGVPYSPLTHSQMKHVQPDECQCLLALKCWIQQHVRMLASIS